MAPPSKRLKTQAPKKCRPEPKTHAARKGKLKRSSLDYASPTDEKDYRPGHGQSQSSRKPKKPSVIVPRPSKENENPADPFNVLDDDAVYLIIAQLSAEETETLRRVSKLWKASSEAHCGRNALKKHFPLAAGKIEGHGSREQENLHFRRHLYYNESLTLGNATRAVLCTGALDWHLDHDTLVWSNKKGDLSIRDLRSRDNFPIISPATSIDFRSFKIPFNTMNSVQLTEDGDMVVAIQGCKSGDLPPTWHYGQKLMKITREGTVLWKMDVPSLISIPSLGKTALYFVERPPNPLTSEPVLAFVKASLEDGSIFYRNQLPSRYGRVMANDGDRHLRLFADEAFAVWRDIENSAYVFSTKTGHVIQVYPRTTRTPPVVGRHSSFIWDINSNLLSPHPNVYHTWPEFHAFFSQRITCQDASPALKFEAIHFLDQIRYRYPHSEWRFSGDHCAFFYFTHVVRANMDFDRRFLGQNEPTDPFTNVWAAIMEEGPSGQPESFEIYEKYSAVRISLPPRSESSGERRPLELDLPWRLKENDFLGMVNDYMVYHSPDEEILLLVDFWPNW